MRKALQHELLLPPSTSPARAVSAAVGSASVAAQQLSDELAAGCERPIELIITSNRSSVLRVLERDGTLRIRAHHIFLDAPQAVRSALVDFAMGRRARRAGKILDGYIEAEGHRIRQGPGAVPMAPKDPRGVHHNLQAIFDVINAHYFDNKVVARIGWSRWGRTGRKRRRSIKMGTYLPESRLIRIHPALDRADVPDYYVSYIVYHEMLHQVVPAIRGEARTTYHPREFRKREQDYARISEARAWELKHFSLLLSARPVR